MKALLINGSPHKEGCTYTALKEVAKTLEEEGLKTEIFWIGKVPVMGCQACGACRKLGRCVYDSDVCNQMAEKMKECDCLVVGSPVYYSGPNGALLALLDRAFYSLPNSAMEDKPAASVVSCRRGGATATFMILNQFFTIKNMPVVSSQYWNQVHGNTPEQVNQDIEGLQTMRSLGKNMAYLVKAMAKEKKPEREKAVYTNFIR